MQREALEQRVARLARAVERAAREPASESRQAALEALARFAGELAAHFTEQESRAATGAHRDAHARLRAELAEIDRHARAAGDWPESWRAVAASFDRFARALDEHERTEELHAS
ncbi:MAG TPA: hypothetical protein VMW19_18665 [Myxococcota bacterium]|nr:hypothetical protein [Myxococcota bacterium]